ncbi:MAG TPA: hypothetical protein VKY15_04755, partial [Acidimicrobiales bacterium]|nr:hypothetical protein [Acidimicrobiales bacterium]
TSTPPFSTSQSGEVLLALVASDGPSGGGQQVRVSGAGLSWSLVKRTNTDIGTAEIWRAVAGTVLSNVVVTSQQRYGPYDQSLDVVTFADSGGTGASAGAHGLNGAPSVTLVPTATDSLALAVGDDWDNAIPRTLAPGQLLLSQVVDTTSGDTFWAQISTSLTTADVPVALSDTSPTTDRWNMSAVEVTLP